ncbi:MAG: DUF5652 family protein, partial [bacterium]|nr:DUF5652 family protein [bacterium]
LNDLASLPIFSVVPSGVLLTLLLVVLVITTVLKAFALWHTARNHQVLWFVAILVLNTLGILEIVYLVAFRKDKVLHAASAPAVASPASKE